MLLFPRFQRRDHRATTHGLIDIKRESTVAQLMSEAGSTQTPCASPLSMITKLRKQPETPLASQASGRWSHNGCNRCSWQRR